MLIINLNKKEMVIRMETRNYRAYVENLKGQKQQLDKDIKALETQLEETVVRRDNSEQAAAIIQEVARITQEQLQYNISELVTLALSSVFENPYTFEVEFVTKRNQTEVNLWFVKKNERIQPMYASGGGVVDIAAFALIVSLWALKNPRTRNTLILDEPFRNLSRKYLPKASEMLKMLSSKMNLQIIMVAHPVELIEAADKVFEVTIDKKGVSHVS